MSTKVVRASKYRHVFGTPFKNELCYTELRTDVPAWDSNFIKANSTFFAIPWSGGGGAVAVLPYAQTGKQPADMPVISGHSGQILDFDFNPFNDSLLATGSTDTTVKIWGIPEGGLKENLTTPLVSLDIDKKVGLIQFHPTAGNVLATAAVDSLVNLWDIETGKVGYKIEGHGSTVQSLSFNKNGSEFVTTCKDKKLRIIDPRASPQVAAEADGHQGTKASKACWLGKLDKIFSAGFTKLSERHYMIWDPRKLATPLQSTQIDVSAGLLMPFYDDDTQLLFLAGKGDGNIRYYEVVNEDPYLHVISEFKSAQPQRGVAMLPKVAVDTTLCEVVRLMKLTTNSVVPVMFQVPRKSELFQADLFPDTAAPEPTATAAEYFAGTNGEPKLVSMKPGENDFGKKGLKLSAFQPKVEEKPKVKLPPKTSDPKELLAQNEELRKRVEQLENENFALKKRVEELAPSSPSQ